MMPRMFGALFRPVQNGLVQFYALAMVLGLVVFLLALVSNVTPLLRSRPCRRRSAAIFGSRHADFSPLIWLLLAGAGCRRASSPRRSALRRRRGALGGPGDDARHLGPRRRRHDPLRGDAAGPRRRPRPGAIRPSTPRWSRDKRSCRCSSPTSPAHEAGRHPVLRRHRRPERLAGRADGGADAAVGPGVVDGHHRARQRVLRLAAVLADRHDGRLPRLRHRPVLRLLRADAGAAVLPHRHLGRPAAPVRRPQVLHLHPDRQPHHPAGRPRRRPGLLQRPTARS